MLGNVEQLPDSGSIEMFSKEPVVQEAIGKGTEAVHLLAQEFLRKQKVDEAWKVLLAS
jgi:hypothetical protein